MNLDFFNSIGNKLNDDLYKLDISVHNNIKNTFIDDFIHELQAHLYMSDAIHKLNKLPKDTIFFINEAEEKYIDCIDDKTDERYDIPRDMFHKDIRDSIIDDCSYVKLREDGFYYTFDSKEDCLKN